MVRFLIASATLIGLTSMACAASIDGLNITASSTLPSNTYAPFTFNQTNTLIGVQGDQYDTSGNIIAKSPFGSTSSTPYDAVLAGGEAYFPGFLEDAVLHSSAVFSGPFGVGGNSLTLVWGTPDPYNTLTIYGGSQTYTILGSDLSPILTPNGTGSYAITISGMGSYDGLDFKSSENSFEFAAVSAVPLPASAPLFGAALVALSAVGYGLKRKGNASA